MIAAYQPPTVNARTGEAAPFRAGWRGDCDPGSESPRLRRVAPSGRFFVADRAAANKLYDNPSVVEFLQLLEFRTSNTPRIARRQTRFRRVRLVRAEAGRVAGDRGLVASWFVRVEADVPREIGVGSDPQPRLRRAAPRGGFRVISRMMKDTELEWRV